MSQAFLLSRDIVAVVDTKIIATDHTTILIAQDAF
jgi:hypothetical protein